MNINKKSDEKDAERNYHEMLHNMKTTNQKLKTTEQAFEFLVFNLYDIPSVFSPFPPTTLAPQS